MKKHHQQTDHKGWQPLKLENTLIKRTGLQRKVRWILTISVALLMAATVVVPTVSARRHKDRYDRLEAHLRANVANFRLALLRTYLPKEGRRALPLPTIQQVTQDGGAQAPLPECRLTSRIDDGAVDFSGLLNQLARGDGDEIDFIVELARALRIDPDPENFPSCAWWGYVDERFFNWIFPDATATYWFQPFLAPPQGEDYPQWLIRGKFVEERYKSYALYDTHFNPFEWKVTDPNGNTLMFDSTVTDYQMRPSEGLNPFITPDLPLNEYG